MSLPSPYHIHHTSPHRSCPSPHHITPTTYSSPHHITPTTPPLTMSLPSPYHTHHTSPHWSCPSPHHITPTTYTSPHHITPTTPPLTISHPPHLPHHTLIVVAVISIGSGAVHGMVGHGDDPGMLCSLLWASGTLGGEHAGPQVARHQMIVQTYHHQTSFPCSLGIAWE